MVVSEDLSALLPHYELLLTRAIRGRAKSVVFPQAATAFMNSDIDAMH